MVENPTGSEIIKRWPEESQEAAQLVIDTYGEPQEATESLLTWHQVGPWKRVLGLQGLLRPCLPGPPY
jgi:hypothetical protein